MSIAINAGATPSAGAPIVQAAPTPADKPVAVAAQPPASRFAELLRRNRAEAPKPAPQVSAPAPAAAPAAPGECADSGEATDTASIESKAAPRNAAQARAALSKSPTGKAVAASADKPAEPAHDQRDHDEDRGEPSAPTAAANADRIDPRVAFDTTIEARRPAGRIGADARDDATDPGAAEAGALPRQQGSDGPPRGQLSGDAAIARRWLLTDASRDPTMTVAVDTSFRALVAEAGQTLDDPGAAPAHGRPVDAMSAAFAATAATGGAELPVLTAASALRLATPIDAPDFAASLGVQVSVLAQDGVQQAELHLNPAEMGPVSIHISLDGTAARVDFGADLAATRVAIERGLPELASALRDAGFTLAGGGVSQHAGGRSAGDDDAARPSRRIDAGGPLSPAPVAARPGRVAARIAAGGVDLYA